MMINPHFCCNLCHCQVHQQLDPVTKELKLQGLALRYARPPGGCEIFHYHVLTKDAQDSRIHLCRHCVNLLHELLTKTVAVDMVNSPPELQSATPQALTHKSSTLDEEPGRTVQTSCGESVT